MGDQLVLERDRRDPLAAGLDHVLRTILDLNEPARIDRDDVAGPEPAVARPAIGCVGRLVIRRRDPRPAHLQPPYRAAVPRQLVLELVADAKLDERERQALLREVIELHLLVGLAEV